MFILKSKSLNFLGIAIERKMLDDKSQLVKTSSCFCSFVKFKPHLPFVLNIYTKQTFFYLSIRPNKEEEEKNIKPMKKEQKRENKNNY